MLAGALLLAALAILATGWVTGRSLPARIASLFGYASRSRRIAAWALGTALTYGASTLVALALLGRVEAVRAMPSEIQAFGWTLGLPGEADASTLAWLGGCLAIGVALGAGIVWVRGRLGKRPWSLGYRSPAAARTPGERVPAALVAVAAGVGEELFFRLLVPLLFALTFGSAAIGFAVSLAAFTLLHRHQGWLGMAAVALVGAWLTYLYLLTGALWLVMLLHVAIDLHALVLIPSSSAASRS